RLHGWVSYAIVPVFALANAGVPVGIEPIRAAVGSRLGLAVIVGLVVGKMLGITLVTLGAVRLGIGRLPAGTTTRSLVGISLVAGIGFTVSIFESELAIESPVALGTAKLSVLIASLLAAVLGVLLLRRSGGSGAPPQL
ncbi:MAG: Na+/H+ antiporter NhaA, partial [Actinobacteria bacterium]|nr:Na+/H+ antiporter NhaA [Actinomycetota bacterium]